MAPIYSTLAQIVVKIFFLGSSQGKRSNQLACDSSFLEFFASKPSKDISASSLIITKTKNDLEDHYPDSEKTGQLEPLLGPEKPKEIFQSRRP